MKIRLSIKNKLVISFGLIMIIGFLICGSIANVVCKDVINHRALTTLARLATDTADKISIILNKKQKLIENLSALEELKDESQTLENKLEFLSKMNQILQFEDLAIIDLKGNSYGANGMQMNISGSPEFEKALEGETSFSPAIEVGEATYFTVATPIRTDEGKIIGVVMGVEDAETFTYLLQEAGISDELMLLDSRAHIVLHSNGGILENPKEMEEMKEDPRFAEVYLLYEKMLRGENGAIECVQPETGEKNYVSYAPIGMGWSMLLVNYREGTLKIMHDVNMILIITTCLIIIGGIIAVYMVAKRLSKRMSEITHYVDTVAQGDFEHSVPEDLLELGDEMGDAARALEGMKVEIEEMLGTIRTCTDYVNEQMEDLTEEVKEELKVALKTEEIDGVECEKIMERLSRLEELTQGVKGTDSSIIRNNH